MKTKEKYRLLKIGLTGGIGTGKTEVGRIFESLGVQLLHADIIAKNLIDSKKEIKEKIVTAFGGNAFISDGKLDRKRMAKIVFRDKKKQKLLNQIVHPYVIEFIEDRITTYTSKGIFPMVMIEAALIYEAGIEKSYDYIVVVDADEEKRIDRIIKRDGLTRSDIVQRIKAQIPQRIKNTQADFILRNDGDLESLQQGCSFIYKVLNKIRCSS